MFKISKLTDYGVVILRLLATKSAKGITTCSARDLSVESGLPLPTVSKLLKIMAKASFIDAKRGAQGGYSFDKDPSNVSLLSLIEVFEGQTAITSCVSGDDDCCSISKDCPQKSVWQNVNEKFSALLADISLAELIGTKTKLSKLTLKEPSGNGQRIR